MRITLLALGTRGDVWPQIALASHLVDRDHDVTVATTVGFAPLVAGSGARLAPMPTDLTTFLAGDKGQAVLRSGGPRAVEAMGTYYSGFSDALDAATLTAVEGAEAVFGNQITFERAAVVSEALGIPAGIAWPMPLGPTGAYPSAMLEPGFGGARVNLLSHRLVYAGWQLGVRSDLRAFRRRLGLAPGGPSGLRRYAAARALQLHAFSPSLLPRPTDLGPEQPMTGLWQLPARIREGAGEAVPAAVDAWIDEGPPPVYLGLGSMPVPDTQRMLADVAAVTSELGVRGLIDATWCADAGPLPGHLHAVGSTDHDLLLPRCRAAVHHGGHGTLAAGLRAGLPTLVCSVFADQPFWGRRVERLGVGAHVRFRKLDRATLRTGLARVLEPATARRATQLGAAIRAEGDGTVRAATAVDDWLVTAMPLGRAAAAPRALAARS
ncbi:glycosyltransferase [Paraconexibacter sp. AEG42_29]